MHRLKAIPDKSATLVRNHRFSVSYPLPKNDSKVRDSRCSPEVLLRAPCSPCTRCGVKVSKSFDASLSISLKHNRGYKIQHTNNSKDATAVRRAWGFQEAWFSDPGFLNRLPVLSKKYVEIFLDPLRTSNRPQSMAQSPYMHMMLTLVTSSWRLIAESMRVHRWESPTVSFLLQLD
jgi:hypothetical protein